MISPFVTLLILCCALKQIICSSELTFELPDNVKQCFYEEMLANVTGILEFQVVTGGQYDVDVSLKGPNQEIIYQETKMQIGTHKFVAPTTGVYEVCFSNEFSTFSHKLVYMQFQNGEEPELPGIEDHVTVLTQLETTAVETHKYLNLIIDHQTRHRLREAKGQKRAKDLNERVLMWAIFETVAIIVIAASQTYMLKSFFSEKRPLGGH